MRTECNRGGGMGVGGLNMGENASVVNGRPPGDPW